MKIRLRVAAPIKENHLILRLKCGFQRGQFLISLMKDKEQPFNEGRAIFLAEY